MDRHGVGGVLEDIALLHGVGNPEVSEEVLTLHIEDVFRFQVSVNDAVVMDAEKVIQVLLADLLELLVTHSLGDYLLESLLRELHFNNVNLEQQRGVLMLEDIGIVDDYVVDREVLRTLGTNHIADVELRGRR